MTDLNLDLNINNYTITELKNILFINNDYNSDILNKKINILKKNIFSLHLSNKEKNEFNIFFNSMEIRLNKYLEIIKMEENQIALNKEIKNLKKQIQKNNTNNINNNTNNINNKNNKTINKKNNTKKFKNN
tara:strand:- start:9836 stop:10228 length:393 start_codon:yes stop_codon:yes gene_type:complete